MTLKEQATTTKNRQAFMKMKNFCASEENINRRKRQPTKWEEIFATHISDKRLRSRIYTELLIRKTKQHDSKMGIGPE